MIRIRDLGALLLVLFIGGCGDDGSTDADVPMDGATDTGADTGADAARDALMDAGADGGADAAEDAGDAGDAGDAADGGDATDGGDAGDASDASVDAGSCGAGPACADGETCWGEGCSCILEIDGDSYLTTAGRAYYHGITPHRVAETAPGTPLTGIVEIMDGMRHTCGLIDDGTVWCWGKSTDSNRSGELGNGAIGGTTTPGLASQVLLPGDLPLTGIAHLNDRSTSRCYLERTTCGIRGADGAVFCWGGDNDGGGPHGFYTDGVVAARPYATQIMAASGVPLTDVAEVELGRRHGCALTLAGQVLCWGMNVTGPLGQGDQTHRQYPIAVAFPGGATADQIGVGADFSCARVGDGVYCWGSSGNGQIGLGDPTLPANHDGCINFCRLTPSRVIDTSDAPLSGVSAIEVAYQGVCARMTDHTLRCWGFELGQVATEPTIGGAMIEIAAMTTCSSSSVPMAIRYLQRDGTLHDRTRTIDPVCVAP